MTKTKLMRLCRPIIYCCSIVALLSTSVGGSGTASAQSAIAVDTPKVTAAAVYAIDVTAGVELMAKNADERRPPASTTKIVSAIVLVDTVEDRQQEVTIEDIDLAPLAPDESRMGLEVGDVLTVQQLLEGMLIQSGSDAAYAAARVAGTVLQGPDSNDDPVKTFVDAMNAVVKSLDLKNSRFVNPVGIEHPRQYSSARDLALLAEDALNLQPIAEIAKEQSIQTVIGGPNPREVTLTNTNSLLDGGAIHGLKTGSTTEAGACIVLAKWEHETNRVITVVLGSTISYDDQGFISEDKRWNDTEAIMKRIERDVRWISPLDKADVPGLVEELAAWQVAIKTDSAIVVPADSDEAVRYLLQLGPAGAANTEVGRVLFFVGSEQIADVPVYQTPIA